MILMVGKISKVTCRFYNRLNMHLCPDVVLLVKV